MASAVQTPYHFDDANPEFCDAGIRALPINRTGRRGELAHSWSKQAVSHKVPIVVFDNTQKDEFVRRLYISHKQELCSHVISKFSIDQNEAEDIVHSVFTRFSEMETLHSIDNPRAFLYKMCGNMALDIQRHRKITHAYAASMTSNEEAFTHIGPEEVAESSQRLGIIERALWCMPIKRRKLLLMSRFDGLSYAEIARQVGLSETVVRKHISKALADCHKALSTRGE